ncbi:MAG TPA: hypothetical protein PK778_08810 [Bacillota bacterium]|nr:hypothetical protein [Bacillota bacterium]
MTCKRAEQPAALSFAPVLFSTLSQCAPMTSLRLEGFCETTMLLASSNSWIK